MVKCLKCIIVSVRTDRKSLYHIGSGSGQQSVTGFPNADDGNSYWVVEAASGHVCNRG